MKRALTHVSALAVAAAMAVPAMAQSQDPGDEQQQQVQSDTQVTEQTANETESTAEAGATAAEAPASEPAIPDADPQADRLVATVGEEEIRQSDVLTAIEGLPQGVKQTPPQMLLPAVVDQLIMRRLIVDEARAEGLETDQEVLDLVDAESDAAMEQALVEVWLKRKIDERVSDENVQAAVEEVKAKNPDMGDTAAIEPQVRQALQVQAMTDIGDELRQDAEITFYDPSGKPVDPAEQQVGSGSEAEAATDGQQQD